MKFCKKCSFENENTVKFCVNCGNRFEDDKLICPSCKFENPSSNKFCGNCGSELNLLKKGNVKVLISAPDFSIFALDMLRNNISGINKFHFLFKDLGKFDRKKLIKNNELKTILGAPKENALKFNLTQQKLAKEYLKWIRENGSFKIIPENQECKSGICINNDSYEMENFTSDKLVNYEDYIRNPAASEKVIENFKTIWNDSKSKDIKQQILDYLSFASQNVKSEDVYNYTLYNIFYKSLSENSLSTGLLGSVIWNTLFSFQKDATKEIINKLEKNKVCILADSVGLGKTYTAISVIKHYMQNNRILVLCPKKLEKNWTMYNDVDILSNPLREDKLNYRVQAHTDLNRDADALNNIDWGSFGLVVIDESHNFRNGIKNHRIQSNRYTFLRDKIMKDGADSKLLMLSATPVNNDFLDLQNQIALAYAKNPEVMDDKKYDGKSINEIFRAAESAYRKWAKQSGIDHTTQQLVEQLHPEFFDMLDDLTIARSRKHIKKYYNESITFPKRLTPISITPELSINNKTVSYQLIYDKLELLNLSIYTPSLFIKKEKEQYYKTTNSNLTMCGREVGILRLMLVNLMKRLESSIASLKITANKILTKINYTIDNINNISDVSSHMYDLTNYSDDFDDDDLGTAQNFVTGNNTIIRYVDMDLDSWKKDLESDKYILKSLLEDLNSLGNTEDSKLDRLYELIRNKNDVSRQINKGNKKIIIFTAFSNTAEYLFKNINEWAKETFGLETALVTGSSVHCTIQNLERGKTTEVMDKILTYFSPKSKEKEKRYPNDNREIDILIATDCISEGQNLQDCDYLINYDIHWNPVRIVQRFGRIDRIGSSNSVIQLVNFWPLSDLDAYLKLKTRVETRMKILNLAATGDDDLLRPEDDPKYELRGNQLKSMLNSKTDLKTFHDFLDSSPEYKAINETLDNEKSQLESLKTKVEDYEDVSGGVSILDYGFNNYRAELSNILENESSKNILEKFPDGIYSLVSADKDCPPGAIFVLRNRNATTEKDRNNCFHPYYLIYIKDDGCILHNYLQSKVILEKMRALSKKENNTNLLYDIYFKETDNEQNLNKYQILLQRSVEAIISDKNEADISSAFSKGKLLINKNKIESKSDLDLVSYLIVI